jgi:hypothetical protein
VFHFGPQTYRLGQNKQRAIDFRFFCVSVETIRISKVYSQEVKAERKLNCNRAHRRCIKICKTGNVQPMKKIRIKNAPIREDTSRNSAPEVQ